MKIKIKRFYYFYYYVLFIKIFRNNLITISETYYFHIELKVFLISLIISFFNFLFWMLFSIMMTFQYTLIFAVHLSKRRKKVKIEKYILSLRNT